MKQFDVVTTTLGFDVGCVGAVDNNGKPLKIWARCSSFDGLLKPEYGGIDSVQWHNIGTVNDYQEWHTISYDKTTEEVVDYVKNRCNYQDCKVKEIIKNHNETSIKTWDSKEQCAKDLGISMIELHNRLKNQTTYNFSGGTISYEEE